MRYALIDEEGRVAQIEADPFEVAAPLRWVEVSEDITTAHRLNDEGEFYLPDDGGGRPLPKLTIIHRLRDAGKLEAFAQLLEQSGNLYTQMIWSASLAFERDTEDWEALKATLQQIDGLDVDAVLA